MFKPSMSVNASIDAGKDYFDSYLDNSYHALAVRQLLTLDSKDWFQGVKPDDDPRCEHSFRMFNEL